MRQPVGDVARDHRVAEALHLLVLHRFPDALLGGQRLARQLRKVTLDERHDHDQTLAGLELRHEREQLAVLGRQVVVQLGQHQDLGAPVLGVRWAFLEPEQRVAGGGQGDTADSVTPFLFGAVGRQIRKNGLTFQIDGRRMSFLVGSQSLRSWR